ncbi:MAG: NPCBM/NEW2 domain-containing protein [Planctomycetales bacterium]|nr:NPCBM/NEW2 domain-containing protein [Planctomycetales bacterium]
MKSFTLLLVVYTLLVQAALAQTSLGHWANAPTPPMGWNSWDHFGTTLTEAQAKTQADAMAKKLLPAGYQYFTVDIQWYEPNAQGHVYQADARLEMDEYGRLLPAVKKFPSAANDAGFKPLADYIHSLGLRFGIHLMRGIPRQAVRMNSPILGTESRATDIALVGHTCAWNPDMFGVDMTKPAAQAYYDSLFQLYASWGVDFVKVDDIARPYDDVQRAEIEAIRRAIDTCGRPMVLSLSPGDTPLARGDHVTRHANMWRISDDFWDRWEPLYAMFGRLDRWTPFRREGAWPDADMLPFGFIEFGRSTQFTQDEQRLCMTLWCLARSPLIFGGDMTKLDQFTLELLTNREVITVNQTSSHGHQLARDGDLIVWAANVPNSRDRYVGLFNAQSALGPVDLDQAKFKTSPIRGVGKPETVAVPLANARTLTLCVTDAGDGIAYDHAVWIEPKLRGPKGTLDVTTLPWTLATAGWGEPRVNRTCEDQPLTVGSVPVQGIGTHSLSLIEYELPAGYDTFEAQCALAHHGSVQFAVFVDYRREQFPERSTVTVSLDTLGLGGKASARDLWSGKDLGEFEHHFGQPIPRHGAGLYRLSP